MNEYIQQSLTDLKLEVMPFTKALLLIYQTHNSESDEINISNKHLKIRLLEMYNQRKLDELFINESLFNGDYIDDLSEMNFYQTPLTKKLLEEYIIREFEEAADISFKGLKHQFQILYKDGHLGSLIASEWTYARPI